MVVGEGKDWSFSIHVFAHVCAEVQKFLRTFANPWLTAAASSVAPSIVRFCRQFSTGKGLGCLLRAPEGVCYAFERDS